MIWADDSTRRTDFLCPIDFSFFVFYSITFDFLPFFIQQATRTANTRPVFICYIQNSVIEDFLVCFIPGQLARRWEVIQLSRLVHTITIVYFLYIHAT